MKGWRLLFAAILVLISIVSTNTGAAGVGTGTGISRTVSVTGATGATGAEGVAVRGKELPDRDGDGLPDGILVEPLTREQQAAIDGGWRSEQVTTRSRPETYPQAKHCTARLEPLQKGQITSEALDYRCFDTFSEALAAATGGRVRVPGDFRPDDLTQEILDSGVAGTGTGTAGSVDAPATDTVIGVDYVDASFSGSSYTWYTTYTPGCSDGTTFGNNYSSAWNDIVSSGRGYGGCNNMKHYENTGYGGSLISCHQDWTSCASMGVMNDQTSSVNLRP